MIRAFIQSLLLTLFLSQTSGFAYNLVDVDPVQRAVDACGKGLNSKYPDAVFDAESANVRIWMLPSQPHDFTIYEVSISFTESGRSGVWEMRVAVSPVPQLPILNYGTKITWSDGANEEIPDGKDYAQEQRLQKAAAGGDADAMNQLGWMYQNGKGVAQDYGKAREWYQKGADAGNTNAMNQLGWLYQNGWGVAQDYGKAREWYQKGADDGNAFGMYNLGEIYVYGWGVAPDYGKAREWFQKSVAAGDTAAMNNLGWLYEQGKGGTQDYGRARELYVKAVAAGDAAAMTNLGLMYENGHGVTQDYAKAREWFQKGADAGNTNAKQALSRLH